MPFGSKTALNGAILLLGAAPALAGQVSFLAREEKPDYCKCLSWKKVYQKGMADCGDGQEYYFSMKTKVPRFVVEQFHQERICGRFLDELNDDACINIDEAPGKTEETPKWASGQWCYVDFDCEHRATKLNGTERSRAKAKHCEPGKDKMLRDLKPLELLAYADKYDIDLEVLVRFAYRVVRDPTWGYVRAFFNDTAPTLQAGMGLVSEDEVSNETRQSLLVAAEHGYGEEYFSNLKYHVEKALKVMKDSGEPIFVDSVQREPPYAVVYGEKAYVVVKNPEKIDGHPSTFHKYKCIGKCDADDPQ